MSAGSRSGVNWMREKLRFVTWASERAVSVLATPGRSSSSTWPSATRPSSDELQHVALADDGPLQLVEDAGHRRRGVRRGEHGRGRRHRALRPRRGPRSRPAARPRPAAGRRAPCGTPRGGTRSPRGRGGPRSPAHPRPVEVEVEGVEALLRRGAAGVAQPRAAGQPAVAGRDGHEPEVALQVGQPLGSPRPDGPPHGRGERRGGLGRVATAASGARDRRRRPRRRPAGRRGPPARRRRAR